MEQRLIIYLGILALMAVLRRLTSNEKPIRRISCILGTFFSLNMLFGYSYEHTQSWDLIFSKSCFIVAGLMFLGYFLLFYGIINAICSMILNYRKSRYDKIYFAGLAYHLDNFLRDRALLKIWGFIMLCWLPYLLINYPAVIHADSGTMLWQYYSGNLTNHHPVLQAIFFGSFVKFGEIAFGSQSLGVFLFALLQFIYGSFIFALIMDYLWKRDIPVAPWLGVLLVFSLAPAFVRNTTAICKDSNYSLYLMLMFYLMLQTVDRAHLPIKKNIWLLMLWFFTILLVCFSRKNGIHLLILTLPALIIYLRKTPKHMLAYMLTFILSLGLYMGGEAIIARGFNISNNDTRESMSIPFQQTARYVRDYNDDVSPEEAEAISQVLDYYQLGTLYNPEISDPVKGTYHAESDATSKEYMNKYLAVWFKMFFKHPDAYIQATLNNIYGYFYPDNIGYYKDLFYMTMCVDTSKIHGTPLSEELADLLVNFNMWCRKLPVIGLLSSLGFFVWVMLFVTAFFITYFKDRKYLVYTLPCIITLLICIASPVNNTMRYGLPIMFISPILFCLCFDRQEE